MCGFKKGSWSGVWSIDFPQRELLLIESHMSRVRHFEVWERTQHIRAPRDVIAQVDQPDHL